MSVLVEFSIPADRFRVGRCLGREGLRAELERVVPAGDRVVPYVWVTGPADGLDRLTDRLREDGAVASLRALDRLAADGADRQQLYRIEWEVGELDLIAGVVAAGGTVLEGGTRGETWTFRLRFPDHDRVSRFYRSLADREVTAFTIDSLHELTARERPERFSLTPQQREALELAAREGYFSTPREVTLAELGDRLEVSKQAVSQRIRRATEEVVLSALEVERPD